MGILSGVVSYLLGLVINLLDVAISGFLGVLGFNLDVFEQYFPAASSYYEVITGFAVGLLLIMFIFQVFKNFGVVLDFEAEDPLKILGKTALFLGMILYSRSITDLVVKLLMDPYSIFLDSYAVTFQFSLLDLLSSLVLGLFVNPFTYVVYIIMLIVLGWQLLKFIVEIVERYIVFHVVLFCAPVVYATGAFKSTAQILKSWCRMVASQGLLLLLNIWSIKLFISFMTVFSMTSGEVIFQFLMGYGFLRFAQKADTLLRILGMNTASTGDVVRSLGSAIGGIAHSVRAMGGIASRAMGGRGGAKGGSSEQSVGSGPQQSGNGGPGTMGQPGGNGGNGGMAANAGNGGQTTGASASGATDSVLSAEKANYADTVLSAAKEQLARERLDGDGQGPVSMGGGESGSAGQGTGDGSPGEDDSGGQPGICMAGKASGGGIPLDRQTKEGLSNIARGLPHDQYDPDRKSFSGGGFGEFTGEDANIIGSSELPPADGYSQSHVKMPDGSNATMYRNNDTGEAHVMQFGSVDNGVIQGSIASIDPDTGKMGDDMAFKAVHDSVPGSGEFSSHAEAVSDGQGGTYRMATGGATDFLRDSETGSPGTAADGSAIPVPPSATFAHGADATPQGDSSTVQASGGISSVDGGAAGIHRETAGDTSGIDASVTTAQSGMNRSAQSTAHAEESAHNSSADQAPGQAAMGNKTNPIAQDSPGNGGMDHIAAGSTQESVQHHGAAQSMGGSAAKPGVQGEQAVGEAGAIGASIGGSVKDGGTQAEPAAQPTMPSGTSMQSAARPAPSDAVTPSPGTTMKGSDSQASSLDTGATGASVISAHGTSVISPGPQVSAAEPPAGGAASPSLVSDSPVSGTAPHSRPISGAVDSPAIGNSQSLPGQGSSGVAAVQNIADTGTSRGSDYHAGAGGMMKDRSNAADGRTDTAPDAPAPGRRSSPDAETDGVHPGGGDVQASVTEIRTTEMQTTASGMQAPLTPDPAEPHPKREQDIDRELLDHNRLSGQETVADSIDNLSNNKE